MIVSLLYQYCSSFMNPAAKLLNWEISSKTLSLWYNRTIQDASEPKLTFIGPELIEGRRSGLTAFSLFWYGILNVFTIQDSLLSHF